MLYTQQVSFQYPKGPQWKFPDLDCPAGDTLLITGPSGCGKTTLLHLLAGILRPAKGSIRIDGTAIESLSPAGADRFRGANIGLIYQRPHFVASLSVMDNLLLPLYFGGKSGSKKMVQQLAEQLSVAHTLHQHPYQLSSGEQQRISIARALVHAPKVVLADEPTSALDDINCAAVTDLLRAQAEERQAALIIVTHDSRLKSVVERQVALTPIRS